MANPIIKIKRGNGEPPSSGITAGEFAFDRDTGMLYLGVTGQYLLASDYEAYFENGGQGFCAALGPLVIPIGAQISNDPTFGRVNGGDEYESLGNSPYTIPTTAAVKAYVATQKAAAAFGFTLEAGNGISLDEEAQNVLVINNTGALEAFGKVQLEAQNGGVVTGTTAVTAIGSTFGTLKLIPQSGIKIGNTVAGGIASVTVENIGVTGINGSVGNITTFLPIQSLVGSTAFANNIGINSILLDGVKPISTSKKGLFDSGSGITYALWEVSHQIPELTFQTGDKGVGGYDKGFLFVPSITFDQYGHIKFAKGITLFGNGIIPAGLTEAVQDIVGAYTSGDLGIFVTYDDNNNTLKIKNTGVRGFTAGGTSITDGIVEIVGAAGSGITISGDNSNPKRITIDQNIPKFKNVTLSGNGATPPVTLEPEDEADSLGIGAGSGISFSVNVANDSFSILNDGVKTLNNFKGDVSILEGTNVQITNANNTITINASGGGDGAISTINGEFLLDGNVSSSGVTGFVSIEGNAYGQGQQPQFINVGQNIVTFRSENTINGDIFVDLSSNIKVPTDGSNFAQITIPNRDEYRDYNVPGGVLTSINQSLISENNLVVPLISAGATGAPYENENGVPYSFDDILPGKELIFTANGGSIRPNSGLGSPSSLVYNASIILSAYPTNQNIVSYMEKGGWILGDCPESGCIGPPPVLGGCPNTGEPNTNTDVAKGTATVLANLVVDGAIVVDKDLFVRGDIYGDGGCKIGIGTIGEIANYFDNCGTLRNPGGIYLNGSDCDVDSNRAIFNVDEFFIKDRLVTIGGASGNAAPINNGLFGTTMDVGFLMPSYIGGSGRTAFIGIDTSDGTVGTFKFIPTATLTEDSSGRVVSGNVGPAKFDTLNNVGISGNNDSITIINSSNISTTSNDRLVIRDRSLNLSDPADISFKGSGHITFGGGSNISLNQNAAINIGTQGGRISQQMTTPAILEFTSSLQGLTFTANTDSLQITKRTSSNTGTYTFPSITTGSSFLVDTDSTQTLEDKTLGENCVIDCGSY